MFDPPERVPYAAIPIEVLNSAKHQELALQVARESIVLLKNEGDLLPLSKDIKSIAVIGPNADDMQILLGNYHGTPVTAVTPLEGIRRKVSPETTLYHAQGCALADGMPLMQPIPTAYLRPANSLANETGLTGRYFDNVLFTGEAKMERVDRQIDFAWKDSSPLSGQWGETFSVQWDGYLVPPVSGTYYLGGYGFSEYLLTLDDEMLVYNKQEHHPILQSKAVELEAGRLYRLRLKYINEGLDPQMQLLWSVPDVDYESQALEVAQKADVIVMVMGLSPQLEGEEMPIQIDGFAGGDRTDIKLPATQERLIQNIHALGKPIVLVLNNGSALAVNWAQKHVPAIVEAWYPGQAGGTAIADVLFGDYNPGGRLPLTFYQSVEDLPPFDDYELSGHTYRYFDGQPLYPFGHGLSYTSFRIDNLRLSKAEVRADETIRISINVTNTDDQDGDEVVQLYTRNEAVSGTHPLKELKGYQRLHVRSGETRTVTFDLAISQLATIGEDMRWVVEPGRVQLMVGDSSANFALSLPSISSVKRRKWSGYLRRSQQWYDQIFPHHHHLNRPDPKSLAPSESLTIQQE